LPPGRRCALSILVNPPHKTQDRLVLPPVQGRDPRGIALNLDVDASCYVLRCLSWDVVVQIYRSANREPGTAGPASQSDIRTV
jgi:hypothetical protein